MVPIRLRQEVFPLYDAILQKVGWILETFCAISRFRTRAIPFTGPDPTDSIQPVLDSRLIPYSNERSRDVNVFFPIMRNAHLVTTCMRWNAPTHPPACGNRVQSKTDDTRRPAREDSAAAGGKRETARQPDQHTTGQRIISHGDRQLGSGSSRGVCQAPNTHCATQVPKGTTTGTHGLTWQKPSES